jgi:hypothetical protein
MVGRMRMEKRMSETQAKPEIAQIPWAEFLENQPPGGAFISVKGLLAHLTATRRGQVDTPDLQLYCGSDACVGVRFFHSQSAPHAEESGSPFFLTYVCRNCSKTSKIFAVFACVTNNMDGIAVKLGEFPPYGPPVPPRVVSLIGPDRDLFLSGRRAENHGLGIGAFAYYRRVIENQKGRLITEIAKVAKRVGASPRTIQALEEAATEAQFSRAVEMVKDAIPQTLLIDGHNPLSLLHSALSEGLHELAEEQCLGLATTIRVVLTELAERISQALRDEVELKQAVSRLFRKAEGAESAEKTES